MPGSHQPQGSASRSQLVILKAVERIPELGGFHWPPIPRPRMAARVTPPAYLRGRGAFSCGASLLAAGEAVELAGAAGLHQRILAASGAAVRGVPRHHVARFRQSLAVVVADDRRAVAALAPVAASGVAAGG